MVIIMMKIMMMPFYKYTDNTKSYQLINKMKSMHITFVEFFFKWKYSYKKKTNNIVIMTH